MTSECYEKENLIKNLVSLKECSECKRKELDEADIFFECLDCGKINICDKCIKTLSQDGNHYYGFNDCSKEEAKLILLMKERNNIRNNNAKIE
jgi:predicted RNA-binding Zn-ribbon protein involved in translation (DUF1610 family)